MRAHVDGGAPLRLQRLLGEGGLSQVWLAATAAGRPVALKTLKPAWRGRAGAERLLRREGVLLARLRHPCVVSMLGWVEHHGTAALVMEYLSGGDLVSLVGAHPRHWIHPVQDVATALRRLKRAGFAHRDVKASNVLLGDDGTGKLIDFGSAARIGAPTGRGAVTAAHRFPGAAPDRVDGSEDAFAMVVLVHQLLSGRLPFGARPRAGQQPAALTVSAEWRGEPAVAALARAVTAALGPAAAAAEKPSAGRLWAVLDVIESVAAAYPRPQAARSP